jgi:excisionase family DNA binding protein
MAQGEGSHRLAPAGAPDWLTLGQAAKYLGVAQSTIRKWSDQGRVPAFYTPGGHRRYKRGDLNRFLDRSGSSSARRGGGGPVILIVDDDERMREYVRVNLEMEGYTVREAGNGEEGLQALEESTPDLVLLDVMMPGVDGWHVAKELADDEDTRDIPVVFLSALAADEDRLRAQELGAVGYVLKPFDPLELAGTVREVLERVARGEREQLNRGLSDGS